MPPIYEENQTFALWVYALTAIAIGGSIVMIALSAPGVFELPEQHAERSDERIPPVFGILHVVLLVVFLVVMDMLYLRVSVSRDEVRASLGCLFPLFRKRIPLSNISLVRAVRYRPLRDAGGWGIRFGRFEGARCRFYNARGDEGVLIETSEVRCIIGSQDPERLCQAIEDARTGGA